MKNLINLIQADHLTQPMFFGLGLSIQRYDTQKYPVFFKNFKEQLGSFWRPEEINLTKDRSDFLELSDAHKRIFTLNLKYQTLLDSVQSRGIPFLMHHVTLPEVEAAMSVWSMFETLHSYSYTYIIKNVYPDPGIVFDEIMKDNNIVARAVSTTIDYDHLIDMNTCPDKLTIMKVLMSIYILEGLRFYVSFACTYAFAENKKMEGNAKIISLINRDENLHLGITQTMINYLRKNEDEGFQDTFEVNRGYFRGMFKRAVGEEIEWAEYLFKDGSLLGLNKELLTQYMKWLANKRMKAIGLEPLFADASNPLGWIQNWTNSKKQQVAPQESEITNYRIGSTVANLDEANFEL